LAINIVKIIILVLIRSTFKFCFNNSIFNKNLFITL